MGVLDKVMQMKSTGSSDSEIIRTLQAQGISPKEIQDAMSQAQIKKAVSGGPQEGMQKSIMDEPPTPQNNYENYPEQNYPQDQGNYPQDQQVYTPQMPEQQYAPMQNYAPEQFPPQQEYPQGDYSQYTAPQDNYAYSGASDTTSLMEISEQVFDEKIKKIKTIIENLAEFKVLSDAKIKELDERLKKIEATINQLQMSILDKIGEYGSSLDSMKKEMSMIEDSFGKVINPVLDKKRKR